MSITGSMYTGVSGLSSHSDAMSVISDNIANVNTVGFKASRANFADILGGTIAGDRVGQGSRIGSVQTLFSNGSLLGTGQATDLALSGDGFFIVDDPNLGGDPMYTRAGQFIMDEDGYMTDLSGNRVQGFLPDGGGNIGANLDDLLLNTASLAPTATTELSVDANLDAETAVSGVGFDIDNPIDTSDFSSIVTVYDSLGQPHDLELFFSKTQDAPTPAWEVNVAVASDDVAPAGPGTRTLLDTATLDFNADGTLAANPLASVNVPWSGANPGTIALDFGSPTGAGGTGADGISTYAAASATSSLSQDGFGSGDLGGIEVGEDGLINGLYTNGETRSLGQIATARFPSNEGLSDAGGGRFQATNQAGEPTISAPGNGGHGRVLSGSLEASNVDLAQEFVTMIAVQRGFQGNSRSITTADEMLSDVVSLKR